MASMTLYVAIASLNGTGIPDTLYMDLHIGEPGINGTGNVAAGNVRTVCSRGAATGGVAHNDTTVSWVPYTETEDITHGTFWDDPDFGQGNCWFIGELPSPVTVTDGEAAFFDIGDIEFEMETYVP